MITMAKATGKLWKIHLSWLSTSSLSDLGTVTNPTGIEAVRNLFYVL